MIKKQLCNTETQLRQIRKIKIPSMMNVGDYKSSI
jgi:hypothetical protein